MGANMLPVFQICFNANQTSITIYISVDNVFFSVWLSMTTDHIEAYILGICET